MIKWSCRLSGEKSIYYEYKALEWQWSLYYRGNPENIVEKSSKFQGKELLRTQVNYVVYRKRERDLKDNGSLKYWLQFKGWGEDISCVTLKRNLTWEWVPVSRACARYEQKLQSGWMIKGKKNTLNIKMLLWVMTSCSVGSSEGLLSAHSVACGLQFTVSDKQLLLVSV